MFCFAELPGNNFKCLSKVYSDFLDLEVRQAISQRIERNQALQRRNSSVQPEGGSGTPQGLHTVESRRPIPALWGPRAASELALTAIACRSLSRWLAVS